MSNRVQSVAILSLLMILGVGVRAQSPQPAPQDAKAKAGTHSKAPEGKIIPPQRVTNLQGFGTTGRIPKFGGGDFLVNSLIFESFTGKIGIGTQTPGSTLSVNGQIETLAGGIKFPDGSVQTTAGVSPLQVVNSVNGLQGALTLSAGANISITPAGSTLTLSAPNALTAVAHDATLTGEGTLSSPLRVVASTESQRQPFAAINGGQFGITAVANILLTTVPSGKLLVIEQVTAHCVLRAGERVTSLVISTSHDGSSFIPHKLIPLFTGSSPGGFDFYGSNHDVKLYAAPATLVRVFATKNADSLLIGNCEATLSGYFIDQP